MFGATMAVPRYMESLIVSMVDNYEAEHEFFGPLRKKLEQQKRLWIGMRLLPKQ